MDIEKRQKQIEELYADLDQRKLVGIILELTIENIDLKKQLSIHGVVGQSEQLACDCDRQPLRYNELGTCKYCGKQKPSEG